MRLVIDHFRGSLVRRLIAAALVAILCATAECSVANSDRSIAPNSSPDSTDLPDAAKSANSPAADTDRAVTSGGNALRDRDRFPWYDAKNDRLQPVILVRRKNSRNGRNATGSRRRAGDQDSDSDGKSTDNEQNSDRNGDSSSGLSSSEVSCCLAWLIWVVWFVIGEHFGFSGRHADQSLSRARSEEFEIIRRDFERGRGG